MTKLPFTNTVLKLFGVFTSLIILSITTAASPRFASASEMRGLWMDDTEVARTQSDWNTLMNDVKNRGFTDVYANLTYAGGAYYESSYLPRWWVFNGSNDQLRMFINAAHQYGLKAHDWILAYNASYGMDSTEKNNLHANGDLAMIWDIGDQQLKETANVYGQTVTWLNYNSSDVRERLVNISEELVTNYPDLDGIHFDYIRSVGDVSTYDQKSKQEFAADTGISISTEDWPAAVMPGYLFSPARNDGQYRSQYVEWQAGNISYTMELIRDGVKAINPNILISAAVFSNNAEPHLMAQDWDWWAEEGYVDALMPMEYTTNTSTFSTMADEDIERANGYTPLYPGINFADTNLTTSDGLQMIQTAREKGTNGFMFYNKLAIDSRQGLPATFEPQQATTIFSDDFDSSLNWTPSDDVTWYTGSPRNGSHSIRFRNIGSIEKNISLAGYQNITVSFKLGAWSLDNDNEDVQCMYYNGTSWVDLARIDNGSGGENNQLNSYTYSMPQSVNNVSSFKLRFEINGSGTGDFGYVDDVKVSGTPI